MQEILFENKRQVNLDSCKIIYKPKGQAGEYSEYAANPYKGCGHKCSYCYVPSVLKITRESFDSIATERAGYIDLLKSDARKYMDAGKGIEAQVMLSFTTDPYHPFENTLTRKVIETLREYGLSFCTLTKGGARALRDIDLFRPWADAFASTLTSLDAAYSKRWERGAALPEDRINTLKAFHAANIFTWVSLEPTLDVNASIQIIEETNEFVDLYKIGRVNYLPMTKTTDWNDYTQKIIEVCQRLNVKHYIKKDLQQYLPNGYLNPQRIAQHH